MAARLTVLLVLLLALAPPVAAQAQDNPFGPIPQAPQEPPPQVQPELESDADEGLSDWQQLLIGAAAVLLLGGIAFAILRDARQAAPADERPGPRPLDEAGERTKGTRPPPKQRVTKNRAKAKTARQARKRNR